MKNISIKEAKQIVNNWWDEWASNNFDPDPSSVPDEVTDVLIFLEEKGHSFSIITGEWQ